jgi:hypothetical protein
MKCPHCLDSFHEQMTQGQIGSGPEGVWYSLHQRCPGCGRSIIILLRNYRGVDTRMQVYPKGVSRQPLPSEVDDPRVVDDYKEAVLVMDDSAKASAALSRRTLQYILVEKAGVTGNNLADQIQQVLDSNTLSADIAGNLDAVRAIGNFAAHPIKGTSTGEIVDVEPHEAEWNLEVLEQLMDFYYVRPAIARKKREQLNEKLASAGKPPLK